MKRIIDISNYSRSINSTSLNFPSKIFKYSFLSFELRLSRSSIRLEFDVSNDVLLSKVDTWPSPSPGSSCIEKHTGHSGVGAWLLSAQLCARMRPQPVLRCITLGGWLHHTRGRQVAHFRPVGTIIRDARNTQTYHMIPWDSFLSSFLFFFTRSGTCVGELYLIIRLESSLLPSLCVD